MKVEPGENIKIQKRQGNSKIQRGKLSERPQTRKETVGNTSPPSIDDDSGDNEFPLWINLVTSKQHAFIAMNPFRKMLEESWIQFYKWGC